MTNEFIWLDIPVGRTLVGIMHSASMVGISFCESSFYDIFMMITTKEYPPGI